MQRLLLVLALFSAVACSTLEEPHGSGAADAGDKPLDELDDESRPGGQSSEPAPRPRDPWIEGVDDIARRFPAFGVTVYHMTYVYEAPKKGARPIGYLRRAARFRASEEVGRAGCTRGWFAVAGGGYVCAGDGVTVAAQPPPYADPPQLPVLSDPLPYRYAKAVAPDQPQYVRLPTSDEERSVQAALQTVALNDAGVPMVESLPGELAALVRSRLSPGFYLSVDRELPSDPPDTRRFLRSVRGGLVRAEGMVESKLPAGLGVALGSRYQLPLAFVYRAGAPALRLDPISGELVKAGEDLPLHSAHGLTGKSVLKAGRRYFITRDGLLLRDSAVRVVDLSARPRQVPRRERWIRVDLDRQTLTAYEDETPVFATLVSSGLVDHATPTGIYRLHAKHITTTMADDMAADGPYSIEDVPWTMYFLGSYALHAAFWHERFGHPRSHGCVNLAPRDARWLFFWTLPELPSAWHGVLADVGEGTTVVLDSAVPYAIEQGG